MADKPMTVQEMGRKGGMAGTGDAKRRSTEHYKAANAKRARCGKQYAYPLFCSRYQGHSGPCSGDFLSEK